MPKLETLMALTLELLVNLYVNATWFYSSRKGLVHLWIKIEEFHLKLCRFFVHMEGDM